MARRVESTVSPTVALAPAGRRSSVLALRVIAAGMLVFVGVRFAALFNDLWLDEIWSLHLLREVHSPWEIVTRLHHDNNHPLNSLFLYAVAPASADWVYRLLSFATGAIAIGLGATLVPLLAPRATAGTDSRRSGVAIGAVLFGGCYLLVHYSSEARGYAPGVACALAACLAVLRGAPGYRWPWMLLYWTACALGLLAHVTFVAAMAGVTVWSVLDRISLSPGSRSSWWRIALWQAGAWGMLAAYHFAFVRRLYIGGGPETSLLTALGDLGVFTFGLPAGTPAPIALLVLVTLPLLALGFLWRHGERARVGLFFTTIFVVPALGLWFGGFTLAFPRYFIVSAAFALALLGAVMTALWSSGRRARRACGLALAGFLLGHAVHTVNLLRFGRGHYQDAIRYVISQDPAGPITLSSDTDGPNVPLFEHHVPFVSSGATLTYLPGDASAPERANWLFVTRLDHESPPPLQLTDAVGEHYRFARRFPHAALSGWDWYVYRREPKR